jgi:hypothetical protein
MTCNRIGRMELVLSRWPDATGRWVAKRTGLATQRIILRNVHPTSRYFIIFESF